MKMEQFHRRYIVHSRSSIILRRPPPPCPSFLSLFLLCCCLCCCYHESNAFPIVPFRSNWELLSSSSSTTTTSLFQQKQQQQHASDDKTTTWMESSIVGSSSSSSNSSSTTTTTTSELLSLEEVEALRAKAKVLREEAIAMETEMNEKRYNQRKTKRDESDQLVDALFPDTWQPQQQQQSTTTMENFSLTSFSVPKITPTPKKQQRGRQRRRQQQRNNNKDNIYDGSNKNKDKDDDDEEEEEEEDIHPEVIRVADLLRHDRWSPEQVLLVVDRLYEKQSRALGQSSSLLMGSTTTGSGSTTTNNISSSSSSMTMNMNTMVPGVVNQTAYIRWMNAMDILLAATAIVDKETIREENQQKGSKKDVVKIPTTTTTTRNSRWTGRVEMAIQTRLRELRREEQAILKRAGLSMTMAATKAANDAAAAAAAAAEANNNSKEAGSRSDATTPSTAAAGNDSLGSYIVQALGRGSSKSKDEEKKSKATTTTTTTTNSNEKQHQQTPQPPPFNTSQIVEQIAMVPLWVPSSFLPFFVSTKESTIGPVQVKALENNVLFGSRFYVTSSDSVPGAAIFRGNIRTPRGSVIPSSFNNNKRKNDTTTTSSSNLDDERFHAALVFQEIQDRLEREEIEVEVEVDDEEEEGSVKGDNNGRKSKGTTTTKIKMMKKLSDQVQLFLMVDPEWKPNRDEREPKPKPVILALSKAVSPTRTPRQSKETRILTNIAKKLAYPVSMISTIAYSVYCYAMNPKFFESVVNQRDLKVLTMCVPVVVGVLSLHVLQEVVHYLVAKRRGLKIGAPVPIPCTQLGLFGCVTPLREFPPNREALLDFALSGSVATFVASLACVVSGILGTVRASTTAIAHFPVLSAAKLKSSFLVGTLLSWLAPKIMLCPLAQPIPIHPLFVIGYSGLIASALNLLPVFRLDGGRACSASLGPRQGSLVSVSTLLFALSLAVSGKNSGLGFLWIVLITIFQRQPEIQARDDVTEVDDVRLRAWFCSFAMAILTLAPFPSGGPGVL